MKRPTVVLLFAITLFGLSSPALSEEKEDRQLKDHVEKVLQMPHRDESDRTRDQNRDPARALEFFGFKENMKVIELAPGNGWYTKVLAPLLNKRGELHLASKKDWLDGLDSFLKNKALKKAQKLPIALDWDPVNHTYSLGDIDFGMNDADMLLSIREYHGFSSKGKAKLNKAIFKALKPGGAYIVIDHTLRHMKPKDNEMRRREDPVQVILDVQAAGFVLEKSSDMFFRPDDELHYEVGRKTVTGNTDRFTLVFRKPTS